jgi:predicted small integral membrane protein
MKAQIVQQRAERGLKAVIALSIGLFGLIVGYTNIVDYDSNWQFVRHVLAMDSFEPWFDASALKHRAITSEPVQRAFYALIITGELVTGVLFAVAGLALAASAIAGRSPSVGKTLAVAGAAVAILVWYTGFAVIGAEWFAMWASTWDGQMKAYTFATFILIAVLYITRPE